VDFAVGGWISWISLILVVDFAKWTVDFVTVTGFREFRFLGRPPAV